jgi:RimJ/RimL family protein N-acetyltransferase
MSETRRPPRASPPAPLAAVAVESGAALATPRLVLRPLRESDRGAFIDLVRSNAEALSGSLTLHEVGEDDDAFFDRQLEACRRGDADRSCCRRVGELAEGLGGTPRGALAGCFHLNSIQRGLSWEADAAWWVDRSLAGRGLATEAVRALLAHAFEPMPGGLGLHGVHCGIEASNAASVRVAEKCGFTHRPGARSYLRVGERWVIHEFYLATPASLGACSG